MEITGWDSVVFTFTPHREVFARVVAAVLARWPDALVDPLDIAADPIPAAGIPAESLPDGEGHLLFYRDAAMVAHMDEAGYAPMADGDGPFSVMTRDRQDVMFAIPKLDEVWAANHAKGISLPPQPYQAWLCTPRMVEVTAVTPDDPESQPFSSWALGVVQRACSPGAEPSAIADVGS